MNRRQFACVTALAGAAPAGALAQRGAVQPGRIPDSAGLISEMVFLDDCVRVAMYDPSLPAAAKTALTGHPEGIHNGAQSPAGIASQTAPQFALASGRLLSAAFHSRRGNSSADARLYHDIAVMRDMAAKAGCDPARPAAVGDLLELLHLRARLGLHTLNPDGEDIHGWLEGLVVWWKDQHDLLVALAAAYTSPDSGKMGLASQFYNPGDPLIRLARLLQFGEVTPPAGLSAALDQAGRGSGYARALADGLEALRKAPKPS
jgi:hypothetical protein